SHFNGAKLPVEQVRWDEARAYCEMVRMRLPTEAEWEYAARAGSATARYATRLDAVAWYGDNKTHEVGQKRPNGYELYAMLGNGGEWTADWYGSQYYTASPSSDPAGPATGEESSHFPRGGKRTLRGGHWGSSPKEVRLSFRQSYEPQYGNDFFGFRCVGN